MKKWVIISILPIIRVVGGCGSNKIDITDTDFDVESCDKYFELVDCILENDNDENYSEDMRNSLREEVKNMQNSWSGLSDNELDTLCSSELSRFESIDSTLNKIGCSVN